MPIFINLAGQQFGNWTVIKRVETNKRNIHWYCVCDCGNEGIIAGHKLNNGKTRSCGCSKKSHGLSDHKFYNTWYLMIYRCFNASCKKYQYYGGRGITVCDEWKNNPKSFLDWCDLQEPIPENYSLDRINNEKNYCPDNCRFASKKEQVLNRNMTIWTENETLCVKDFVEKYGKVPYKTALNRIHRGWNFIEAATIPRYKKRNE